MKKLFFLSLLVLSGCAGSGEAMRVQGFGGARWPKIEIPERIQYTDSEKEILNEISKKYPELTMKITTQMKVMRVGLETYDKERWKHNAEGLRTSGYTESEIVQFLGPDPNKPDTGVSKSDDKPDK